MNQIVIREAAVADIEAAGRLTAGVYVGEGHIPEGDDYVAELRDAATRAAAATLLVVVDGDGPDADVVATATFARPPSPLAELAGPGEAEIRMLAVAPQARGRGVARALVEHCLDVARSHGDERFVLTTMPTMVEAQRMYERLGFHRTPERDWMVPPDLLLITYAISLQQPAHALGHQPAWPARQASGNVKRPGQHVMLSRPPQLKRRAL